MADKENHEKFPNDFDEEACGDLPKVEKKRGQPNATWQMWLELTFSEQCLAIQNYLKSMADPEKKYPAFFDKGAKANFRKAIAGYRLINEGQLWFTSTTNAGIAGVSG